MIRFEVNLDLLISSRALRAGGSRPNAKRLCWGNKRTGTGKAPSSTRRMPSCLWATVHVYAQDRYDHVFSHLTCLSASLWCSDRLLAPKATAARSDTSIPRENHRQNRLNLPADMNHSQSFVAVRVADLSHPGHGQGRRGDHHRRHLRPVRPLLGTGPGKFSFLKHGNYRPRLHRRGTLDIPLAGGDGVKSNRLKPAAAPRNTALLLAHDHQGFRSSPPVLFPNMAVRSCRY